MTENMGASGPPEANQGKPSLSTRRGPWRSVIYPVLVISAIAAALWWLDSRSEGGALSPSGERYGLVDLPVDMVPAGTKVKAEEGALAPDFLLEKPEGGELRLSDLRGRPVVVNFWATWCASCRKEIPELVAAYDHFRDAGLVIIGVDLQESDSIDRHADAPRPASEAFGLRHFGRHVNPPVKLGWQRPTANLPPASALT